MTGNSVPEGVVTILSNPRSMYYDSLVSYLKMGNVDQALEQAYSWIKDGLLPFPEWCLFVRLAKVELANAARREVVLRG